MKNNFIDQNEIYDMVEENIARLLDDPKYHYKLELAKNEGWLGWKLPKSYHGLLGYYRTNIACQIKAIQRLNNPVEIPSIHYCFASFFNSEWFKNESLKNGFISFNLCKKWHIDVIKTKNYYQPLNYYQNLS